ncbi:hypothetical protein KUTeg_021129 [Tegillarca granosa]|uniref:EGF-like domain-containing protein n=1 Tax=Tegillarca granosa TaxID=220873 RepID=A0ABQ9EF14_TEGGR|nr:hypothetical protein KUTeg_021129 [Tegillarca granosa]
MFLNKKICGKMKILTVMISLAFSFVTQAAVDTELLEKCCMVGSQWASSRDRCDSYPQSVDQVREDDQRACRSILTVCCMKERQHLQCLAGQRSALEYTMCSIRDDVFGSEQFKECCHCCQLGLSSRSMNGDCNLLKYEEFGGPCDEVFHDCCFSGNDTDVNDINECELYPAGQLCSHICRNTQGSYRCECRPGFKLHSDKSTCIPVDSGVTCSVYNPCQQRCLSGDDGVRCACDNGYQLAGDGVSCEDLDECRLGRANCPRGSRCVNTEGSYTCEAEPQQTCPQGEQYNPTTRRCERLTQTCENGYGFNVVSQRCEDLDECILRMHQCRGPRQICVNTVGSYQCHCEQGFRYDRRTRYCYDIDECALRTDRCTPQQRCENTIGSYTCRRIIGCGTGYTLQDSTQECIDIDECATGNHNCRGAYSCLNIDGSFRCVPKECPEGYRFSSSTGGCEPINCQRGFKPDRRGMCVDINECEDTNKCSFTQECINTYGSYRCENIMDCQTGFEMNPNTFQCEDVDECARNSHECINNQQCINRPGSYICACPEGYRNDGSGTCRDINECAPGGNACPSNAQCINTQGSFRCQCDPGLRQDGRRCLDIDECQEPNRCQHNCVNLIGSYQCTCRFGYRLASDGRTCQDINECAEGTARCPGQDTMCFNTRGSYKCPVIRCPSGFIRTPIGPRGNSEFVIAKDGALCTKVPCSFYDQACFQNKTRSISWQFFALPSLQYPFEPANLLDIKTVRHHLVVTMRLYLLTDDRNGTFTTVVGENSASLMLMKPVQGPADYHLILRLEYWNVLETILYSMHFINVLIDVAPA